MKGPSCFVRMVFFFIKGQVQEQVQVRESLLPGERFIEFAVTTAVLRIFSCNCRCYSFSCVLFFSCCCYSFSWVLFFLLLLLIFQRPFFPASATHFFSVLFFLLLLLIFLRPFFSASAPATATFFILREFRINQKERD